MSLPKIFVDFKNIERLGFFKITENNRKMYKNTERLALFELF